MFSSESFSPAIENRFIVLYKEISKSDLLGPFAYYNVKKQIIQSIGLKCT